MIFRYLKGNLDLGLWYPRESDFNLIGYSDADFAGCKVDRKSVQVVVVNFWVKYWSHGQARSRNQFQLQLQKLST